jgi:hypothetical protein
MSTEALAILLNFYEYQASLGLLNYLEPLTDVNFNFNFWLPPIAHRWTLNCNQGPATNHILVSDATIPVLRGYRRHIWHHCCAIATIHLTK